ncbi:M57 family metalloprotease [Flagellimonas sp. S3867]|uniref:M57 family metalloprotease n=1 Tax=Flagellimonas sp. S3867 TaxID=2768063 RepID=UPI001683AAEF|nr:M57 family metalloprotease [Flagellimonas sp. S3867]
MKNLTEIVVLLVGLIVFGCTVEPKETTNLLTESELTDLLNGHKEFTLLEDYGLSKREIENFQKAGFEGEYVRVFESRDTKSGQVSIVYEIGRDGYISEEGLFNRNPDNYQDQNNSLDEKNPIEIDDLHSQYRISHLVSVNNGVRIIEVKAINFFYFQNMDHVAEGLVRAVENYNNLNLDIQFDLNFYTIRTLQESWPLYTPGINVVIDHGSGSNEPGGSALYPSFGNPGSEVRIHVAANNQSINANEGLVAHEIGHCLGMRHTDFFNRSISCPNGGNEGAAGVGAIHIPGTPTQNNIDMDSLFLACLESTTDGEFSDSDIVALQALY